MSGKKKVQRGVLQATEQHPTPAKPSPVPDFLTSRFVMKESGLWKKSTDPDKGDFWICGPFEVLAETRDADGTDRGLWLCWVDREGGRHEAAIPRTMLTGDGAAVRERLAYGGLMMHASAHAKGQLLEYLSFQQPAAFARCVPTVGWHHVGASRIFVQPCRVYGHTAEKVIFQPAERVPDPFGSAGTLAEWRDGISALCPGNTRLLLAVSVAFAGPLLELVGEDGGGMNLTGISRLGKSSALMAAASVWGGTPGAGAAGFVCPWRSTANALEAIAGARSDAFLPLDEMSQIDPKALGEAAYMLANGSGKMRARRDGMARPTAKFRVMMLSTGERGLAETIAEIGHVAKAGQEVRLVDVPANAGAGMGVFGNIHGCEKPEAFVLMLRERAGRLYGTAAPVFIEHLTQALARDDAGLRQQLRARITDLSAQWLLLYADVSGQVGSVARRFALAAVAGELATEIGITGWEAGLATDAVKVCFESWLDARGSVGHREDQDAIRAVRDFIHKHGSARFVEWREREAQEETHIPAERQKTISRAGWKRETRDAEGALVWVYYFTSQAMNEALAGQSDREAKRLLSEKGFLCQPDVQGKYSRSIRPPGETKTRLYEIDGSIMEA